MRRRIRPKYSDEQLAQIYAVPHDADIWEEHKIRVAESIKFIYETAGTRFDSVADLSCGNGAIIDALVSPIKIAGDFAPGYPITGPIEETINEIPRVELFICSETLEHLDDPDSVLADIKSRTKLLFISTPYSEDHDNNPEHYWSWGASDILAMLEKAGFTFTSFRLLQLDYYTYQLWMAY